MYPTYIRLCRRIVLLQPVIERRLLPMNRMSSLLFFGLIQSDHLTCGLIPGEQDPAFLEKLSDRGSSVIDGLVVSLRIARGRALPILRRYVSSREDMRGRERR